MHDVRPPAASLLGAFGNWIECAILGHQVVNSGDSLEMN